MMLEMILLAAIAVTGINERPEGLLGSETPESYSVKLAEAIFSDTSRPYIIAGVGECNDIKLTSESYHEIAPQDIKPPIDVFYQNLAHKPAIWEHVILTGCGKNMRLNLVVAKTRKDQKIFFAMKFPGNSLGGIVLHTDTYRMVSLNNLIERRSKKLNADCSKPLIVYNMQIKTSPKSQDAPWKELWSIDYCGDKSVAEIDYSPNQLTGGTDIEINLNASTE